MKTTKSQLFAFNCSEEASPVTIEGHFDKESEVWVGAGGPIAGPTFYGTYVSTVTLTQQTTNPPGGSPDTFYEDIPDSRPDFDTD